jgi:hypothetical protein
MKKIIFICLNIFLLNIGIFAQTIKEFPDDDEGFIKTYSALLKTCNREDCKALTLWFDQSFKTSKANAYLPIIKTLSKTMLLKKATAYPVFYNFTTMLKTIDSAKINSNNIETNLKALQILLEQCNPGNIKNFTAYNEYLIDLFSYNSIYYSKSKKWKTNTEFNTQIENNVPVFLFQNSDIIGTTENDTLLIKNATGKYFPITSIWYGNKGKTNFNRVGFDANNNFVEFNEHEIDFNKSEFIIENSKLTFKPYIDDVLLGKYTDKLLQTKSQNIIYPKFISDRNDVQFKTNSKEVKLIGAFMLEGINTFCVGSEEKNAELTLFDKNNKEKILIEADRINVKNFEQINVEEAIMKIKLDSNEIMHPYINFSYDTKTKNVKAYRDITKPLAKQTFSSDYHKMYIYADEFKWNIDSTNILFGMIGISDNKPAIFESYNYYYEGLENKYKGTNEAGPLLKIYRYYESTQDRNIDAFSMAGEINANAPFFQTEQIFYKLTEDGYIGYNSSTKTITIKDKLINQVLSSKQKQDYDNIKFASFKKYTNARLNVNTNILEIYGIEEIKISGKSQVKFIPSTDTVRIQKNRNLQVGGRIIAGKVDFISPVFYFDYDSYTFKMKKIDSLVLYIPEGDGKPNEQGIVKLVKSETPIQNLSGILYVAEPDNKSGSRNNLKYPFFSSKDTANTFYDNGKNGDKYNREDFKFNIMPFEIDSLTVTATEKLDLGGELLTGGIFEPLKTNLTLQEDKSLGTTINTTNKGLKLYGKESRYFSSLKLSKDGLSGKGNFEFGSAVLYADTAFFFLDSVFAEIDSIRITESSKYKFPDAKVDELKMSWNVKADSIVLTPINNQKISMYKDAVNLDGSLILNQDKLKGVGTLEWNKTKLTSQQISFADKTFEAKNGQLNLTNEQGISLLKSNDVNAFLNLTEKIADIELNKNDTIPLESFKYIANPKFLKFDLAKNTLQLKSATPSSLFFLQSTDPNKELLTFETSLADLNLNTNTIHFGGIKDLKLADSKVQPDKNEIYIEADGSIRILNNATLIFNADSNFHKVKNATIDIISRNNFTANAEYEYKSIDGLVQNIKIPEIAVNTSFKKEITIQEGKKKSKQMVTDEDKIYTYAKTEILEEDKFKLNKKVLYKGLFEFDSKGKEIFIDGFAKIVLSVVETDWIPIKQKLDPNKPEVSIDSLLAKATNLVTGLFYDKYSSEFYTNVLQEKRSQDDINIFSIRGNMSFNNEPNVIIFGNDVAFTKPITKASALKYNEVTKKMVATGEINLGLDLGENKAIAIGDFEYNNDKNLVLNADLAIKTRINPLVAEYVITSFISADSNFIYTNYRRNNILQRTLASLCNDTLDGKYIVGSLYLKDSIYIPTSLPYNLILSGTKFYWDAIDASFKSVGQINLPYFGQNIVKRPYDAYVELGYGENGDFINIVFENKMKEWLYIKIKKGQMGIASSIPDIYGYLAGLPDASKNIRNGRTLLFELLPADNSMKDDFMLRMDDFSERFKSKLQQK